ncbi:MAG: FtsX-like permease family protein [Lachnospiraceae bacterium]|nr:FtsX-like permease family protein [Lachnospiraceae bacterium]
MFRKMIQKDFKRNKGITIALTVFVLLSTMLLAAAVSLIGNLTGAVTKLMEDAKTPHFLQMHAGAIDYERMDAFAKENSLTKDYQILPVLNIESGSISLNGNSLDGSVQDNGFVYQSAKFDYLLDLSSDAIEPKEGEVYVPICYQKEFGLKVGETLTIHIDEDTVVYQIAGFLRDSQMNSTFASSKRFLISKADYDTLSAITGQVEYLIEFRLIDPSKCSAFETAYMNAGLEANGPTITYPLFKMINALADGITAAVIILISILCVLISFLCIRFTLLATIEEDYREIGVMKALGIKNQDIKKMYLGKYQWIARIGCVAGYLVSLVVSSILLKEVRLYMGEGKNPVLAFLLGMLGTFIIYGMVVWYVRKTLKKLEDVSPMLAIRFGGEVGEKKLSLIRPSISKKSILPVNIRLGIGDVKVRKRLYSVLLVIFTLASFIVIVPVNLYTTVSSEKFISYMGAAKCDMRFDLQQEQNLTEKAEEIKSQLDQDTRVTKSALYVTAVYPAVSPDGSYENMKIESGDLNRFPLTYLKGKAPQTEQEIALSKSNADNFEKEVGDELEIIRNGENVILTVSGIYQDLTNGGKTAKTIWSETGEEIMWYIICADLKEGIDKDAVIREYKQSFSYTKVSSVAEYITQTLGGSIASMKKAAIIGIIIGSITSAMITMLFLKMLLAKDKINIGIMKGIGFSNHDIRMQYMTRTIFILIIGLIAGAVLANTLGAFLAGLILSTLGISKIHFIINGFLSYLVCPLLLAACVVLGTMLCMRKAGNVNIAESVKE